MDPRPGAEEKALFLVVFMAKESFPTRRALAAFSFCSFSPSRVTAVFLRDTVDSRFVFLRLTAVSELSRTINDGTLEIVDDNETKQRLSKTGSLQVKNTRRQVLA